jgi:hypothetical protein
MESEQRCGMNSFILKRLTFVVLALIVKENHLLKCGHLCLPHAECPDSQQFLSLTSQEPQPDEDAKKMQAYKSVRKMNKK